MKRRRSPAAFPRSRSVSLTSVLLRAQPQLRLRERPLRRPNQRRSFFWTNQVVRELQRVTHMANAPDFEPQMSILSGSGEGSTFSRSADFFLLTDGTEQYATYSLAGQVWFPIPNNQSIHVTAELVVLFKWNIPPDAHAQLMIASVAANASGKNDPEFGVPATS